jgi:hypothetical protein
MDGHLEFIGSRKQPRWQIYGHLRQFQYLDYLEMLTICMTVI